MGQHDSVKLARGKLEAIDAHAGALDAADVILVFGTRHWTPAELAADLYLAGLAPFVVTTGGSDRHPKGLSEAAVHRDLLVASGVPRDAVVAETNSISTTENVTFALPLIEQAVGAPRSVIAVVKWYHRRALVTLCQHAPSVERVFAADYEPFNTDRRLALSRANWRDACPQSVEREMKYMAEFAQAGIDRLARTDRGWVRS